MGRTVDFGDKSIKKGFGGPDKDKKVKVKAGEKLIVRVVSKLEQYMAHSVHDVMPPKRDAKTGAAIPSVFNMNCAQAWNETEGEWAGECRGHDRDYDVTERYVAGALVLGIVRGSTVLPLKPADTPKFWDMTSGRAHELSGAIETKFPGIEKSEVGKKLRATTLVLGLKEEGGAEEYQKLTISVWEGEPIPVTPAHVEAYKEEIPEILKEVSAPATLAEQDRRLKKKRNDAAPAAAAPAKGSPAEPQVQGDELDDLDLDGTGAQAAPAPAKKPAARARPKAPAAAPPPEEPAVEEEPAAEDELAADEPAPPPARKAAPAAVKKTVVAVAVASKKASDPAVDEMLDGLENG